MHTEKLISILRNPIGIESAIVKEARLLAADKIENDYSQYNKVHNQKGLADLNHLKPKNDYITDLNNAQAKVQACLSDVDVNKVRVQKELFNFDPNDFTSAPKNNIQEAKPDMSELPLDLLTELLCPCYLEGSKHKYYRNSWRKGFKMSIMMAACLRHLTKFFFMRETYDTETLITYGIKKHHLGAAMFCIISMYNDHKNHPHNDDRRKP